MELIQTVQNMCSQSVGPTIQGVNLKNILNKKGSYNFSLVHFNCRSMASNFDKVKDSLKGLDFPFDVLRYPRHGRQ